jgi:hypothetical protein
MLLAEKRERRNEEKADPFTFSRPLTRARFFFFFFPLIWHCMETTREAKTPLYRASSDVAFLERVCSSFFYYVLKRTSLHTLFSYFFLRASLTQRGQNKGKRDLFLPFILTYIYIRNKSHLEFFLSRAISLTASLWQAMHGVRKQEKKGIDFTYDLINVAKIPM